MKTIGIYISNTAVGISPVEVVELLSQAAEINAALCQDVPVAPGDEKTGEGKPAAKEAKDMLGWIGLPSALTLEELLDIERAAASLRELADVIVVIGIGGSYLGAKTVLDALGDPFEFLKTDTAGPKIVFAGQNLSEDYLAGLLAALEGSEVAAIVVSKSGTTIEPAIAFRLVRQHIEKRYGKSGAAQRIVAVTDADKGLLKALAEREGYRTFVIPDNVGGRYSVLTPVGLLPMAVAGIDIDELIRGARDMEIATHAAVEAQENPAAVYAAVRNALYRKGYKIEILAVYEPALSSLAEWWKQLFGESEGKQGKGIFPAGVTYTTDLHSLGQYIQQGERTIFETVLSVSAPQREVKLEPETGDPDSLDYLAGKRISEINRMAQLGVALAHTHGGVPVIEIAIPEISPYWIGALLYFFEKACAISGRLLGVNPFDQPGVEEYKKNMFALLGRPGF